MRTLLKKIIYSLPIKFLLQNIILLESNPDYCDNAYYIYKELLRRGINKKYKIIWVVNDIKPFANINIKNVYFLDRHKKLKFWYYNMFSKYILDCNQYIYKKNKHQFRIHLGHGSPLKMAYAYVMGIGKFDYYITISDFFKNYFEDLFKDIDCEGKIYVSGFPRNDGLFHPEPVELYPKIKRKKTILWFPTFRNHKSTNKDDIVTHSKCHFEYGVPCVNTKKEMTDLNNYLKKNNTLLIIKNHPAEDMSKFNVLNLSNIVLLDKKYENNDIKFYDILSACDALITDYSGIYYDYLLTRKPLGLAISDLDEYKSRVTLAFDNYYDYVKGNYLYNVSDIKQFIKNVIEDKDIKNEEREKALKRYHKYIDGDSSKRVVDLLIQNMER